MDKKSKTPRLLLVTGEISADMYGSRIIDELRVRDPKIEILGVGGRKMAEKNIRMLYDSCHWSSIGYIESLKKLPRLFLVYFHLRRILRTEGIDLLVCIDFPGFNMRLVRYAKVLGIPSVYIYPPAKFANDPADVRDAAENITQVVASFRRTYDLYQRAGARVEFIGHPIVDLVRSPLTPEEFRLRYNLQPGKKVIALLPGSRPVEVFQILPILLGAAREFHLRHPEVHFIVPILGEQFGCERHPGHLVNEFSALTGTPVQVAWNTAHEVLQFADAAVVTSGTATLEAAFINVPLIIVYRVTRFTAFVARLFNRIPTFIGLPNLLLNEKAVPELIQDQLTPANLADEIERLVFDPDRCARMKADFDRIRAQLGDKGVPGRLAELVFRCLGEFAAR